jgi:hypothetical protein
MGLRTFNRPADLAAALACMPPEARQELTEDSGVRPAVDSAYPVR